MTVTELTAQLATAKAKESTAKAERLRVEAKILTLLEDDLKDEGTTRVESIKVVTGFTRSWDQNKLKEAAQSIKPEFFPFSLNYKEDVKQAKAIQAANPGLWDTLSPALTLKPKKPAVSIVELKEAV